MEIKRQDHTWGTSLLLQPFAEIGNAMQIVAEVTPRPNRNPDIRFQFSGSPPTKAITLGDLTGCMNSIHSMVEQARAVASELKNQGGRAPPKKKLGNR